MDVRVKRTTTVESIFCQGFAFRTVTSVCIRFIHATVWAKILWILLALIDIWSRYYSNFYEHSDLTVVLSMLLSSHLQSCNQGSICLEIHSHDSLEWAVHPVHIPWGVGTRYWDTHTRTKHNRHQFLWKLWWSLADTGREGVDNRIQHWYIRRSLW